MSHHHPFASYHIHDYWNIYLEICYWSLQSHLKKDIKNSNGVHPILKILAITLMELNVGDFVYFLNKGIFFFSEYASTLYWQFNAANKCNKVLGAKYSLLWDLCRYCILDATPLTCFKKRKIFPTHYALLII